MKATQIFEEYFQFVELVDDFLYKLEKKNNDSRAKHNANMAERNLKTAIAKFRMVNKKPKHVFIPPKQQGFNFLAR